MDLNIASPQFKANPYPHYERLRAHAPVCRVLLPNKQPAWLITRYDDVAAALKDERFCKDKLNALTPDQAARQPWVPAMFKPLERNMLDLDASSDHTRLRALVQQAFTPKRVEEMRERVQRLADSLLDAVQGRGRMNLIADYALPIPTTVIAEMLGVPVKDRHRFHRWSSTIVSANAHPRSRWTLALLQAFCEPLTRFKTLSGVWRRLKKWRIRWKRGREYVTSPDPLYATKMAAIADALTLARQNPEAVSVLYSDETTCYRTPYLGHCWHEQGPDGKNQPKAPLAHAGNRIRRIVGTRDVVTGRVLYRANRKIGVYQLCAFLKQIRKAYGSARRIVLIWDNWPIHYYDNVLAEAKAQRIELLNLPTYAPWTNPIEKVWRKLKQEIVCMHQLSEQWAQLKERIHAFLKSYDREAPDLLHYVGLSKALEN